MQKKGLVGILCILMCAVLQAFVGIGFVSNVKAATYATITADRTNEGKEFDAMDSITFKFTVRKYSATDYSWYYCNVYDENHMSVASTSGPISDFIVGTTELSLFWSTSDKAHNLGNYTVEYHTTHDQGGSFAFKVTTASGTLKDGKTWNIDENGKLTVSGTGIIASAGTFDCILEAYEDDIKSVVIGEGITGLGEANFMGCSNLVTVTLPSTLKTIAKDVFRNCSSLTSINLPDSLLSIGEWAFAGCISLETIVIPNKVSSLPSATFKESYALTNITIPLSVKSIGFACFENVYPDKVYYKSCNESDWSNIKIEGYNDGIKDATIVYSHDETIVPGKAATCSATGLSEGKKCSKCGKVVVAQTTIPKLNHSYGEYTYDNNATCAKDGTKTAICRYGCGTKDTITATGTKLSHKVVTDPATNPTCTTPGKSQGSHCSICNQVIVAPKDTTPALGHKYDNYVSDDNATCTSDGTKTAVCSNGCGTKNIVKDVGTKLPHNIVANASVEPTCTMPGKKGGSHCSSCGMVIEESEISGAAKGHSLTKISAIAATATRAGNSEYYKCNVCGKCYRDSAGTKSLASNAWMIPALGKATPTITTAIIKSYKAKNLKKKKITFKLKAKCVSTKKLTYTITKGKKKCISVSVTGTVTLKKKCPKGTYKITIKAPATDEYYAVSKVITIKVK